VNENNSCFRFDKCIKIDTHVTLNTKLAHRVHFDNLVFLLNKKIVINQM
jgi:hypothetical protein